MGNYPDLVRGLELDFNANSIVIKLQTKLRISSVVLFLLGGCLGVDSIKLGQEVGGDGRIMDH